MYRVGRLNNTTCDCTKGAGAPTHPSREARSPPAYRSQPPVQHEAAERRLADRARARRAARRRLERGDDERGGGRERGQVVPEPPVDAGHTNPRSRRAAAAIVVAASEDEPSERLREKNKRLTYGGADRRSRSARGGV